MKKLNSLQKEAVQYGFGPLLIIAGAGTGKTTVITERIKFLISHNLAKPHEILALTFTEKASREMETRVDEIMPYGYTSMWISTFHKFCDRILRDEIIQIGFNPGYKLISGADSYMLLRKHIFNMQFEYFRPLGNPGRFISGMLQHFSRLADEDITPNQYIEWVKYKDKKLNLSLTSPLIKGRQGGVSEDELLETKKYQELSRAYKFYSDLKIKEGMMDFSDLISKTILLFRTRKNILERYKKSFKFILIDEFQDTNIAQYELIKLLMLPKNNPNLTVVGDDNQSIYKFRGAAISNILYFQKDYKKCRQIILNKNYRSFQYILDSAYRLIKHNDPDTLEATLGISKKLKSTRKNNENLKIELIHENRVEDEAEMVAKKINELKNIVILNPALPVKDPTRFDNKQGDSSSTISTSSNIGTLNDAKYKWSDFAILVRANSHADPFVRALTRQNIPFQFLGPSQLYRQPEIKNLIAYLQVLNDFNDDAAFFKVLSMEFFKISIRDLVALNNFSKKNSLSLFESCEIISKIRNIEKLVLPFISEKTREQIIQITKMVLKHLELTVKESAGQLLFYFLQDSGMLTNILEYKTPIDERQAENITKFFNKLKSFEVNHEEATVSAVLDYLVMSLELGESPLSTDTDWFDNNAVNILTIHSSKGLEFPIVFLVNMVSQRFPTTEKKEQIPIPDSIIKEILPKGDPHLEEERRLCYVGVTRAKDQLFLTAANYYGEGKREKKISPFVYEILPDIKLKTNFENKQLSLLDYGKKLLSDKQKTSVYSEQNRTINFLSYSQIETFKTCPLHYKLKYILKIPTTMSPALSFGITMHLVLKDVYQNVLQKKSVNKKNVIDLLEKNWINLGYENKKYAKLMKKRGEKYLISYLEKEFNPKTKVLLLEEKFVFPISCNDIIGCHPEASAEGSSIKEDSSPTISTSSNIGVQNDNFNKVLKIGGKIDRIDDLGNNNIEIIDYKTGRIPSKREIDRDLQMSIYALAGTEIPNAPFGKKPDQIKLSFYYFDTQEKISTTRTREQLDQEKINLLQIADKIENSDYKCSGSKFCENCEYNLWCGV